MRPTLEGWDKSVSCELTSGRNSGLLRLLCRLKATPRSIPTRRGMDLHLHKRPARQDHWSNKVTQPAGENQEFGSRSIDPAFGSAIPSPSPTEHHTNTGLIPACSGYSVSENVATLAQSGLLPMWIAVWASILKISPWIRAQRSPALHQHQESNIIVRKHTSPADDTTLFRFELSRSHGYLATTDISDGHHMIAACLCLALVMWSPRPISSVSGWKNWMR
jgi:hypothetical protein